MRDNSRAIFYIKIKGQSMIEVVIGIAVVVVLAISLITTTLITQRTAASAKNNSQATKLAQQAFEQLRIYRDRKGFSSIPADPTECYKLINTNNVDPTLWDFSAAFDCNSDASAELLLLDSVSFYRKIQLVDNSSVEKEATVTVNWTESSGVQNVVHKSVISAWCSGQIVPGSPCSTP